MSNLAVEAAAPDLMRTDADLALIERTPWQERIPARNTCALLRAACERRPQAMVLRPLLGAYAIAGITDHITPWKAC